jgi:hypothetical protein
MMKMGRTTLLAAIAGITATLLLVGCEIDSAESSTRNVDILVSGFYEHPSGRLVDQNTGNPILSMDLRQTGDQLEGIDNNGNIFKGTIGQVDGTLATFNIDGMTTAGADGTISGSIEVSSTEGTGTDDGIMRGTWIEPTITSTVYGEATVPENSSGCDGFSLTISDDTLSDGETATLTVAAGTGPYQWETTAGSLNATETDSASNTYTAEGTNSSATISVTDANGCRDSVGVTIN